MGCQDLLHDAINIEKAEISAISQAPAVLLRSATEIDYLTDRSVDREKLHLFPICRDIVYPEATFDQRSGYLFLGGYLHSPNIDAVKYFLSEIYPFVRDLDSTLHFYIAGSHSNLLLNEIDLSSYDAVTVVGFVPSLRDILNNVRVSIAPLRYGAGTKGKVVSSMCHGLPCVASHIAVEGLVDLEPGTQILVQDDPQMFAEDLVRLHNDRHLWEKVSSNSLQYAINTASIKKMEDCIHTVVRASGLML